MTKNRAMAAAAHGISTLGMAHDQASLAPNSAVAAGAIRFAKKPAAADMKPTDWSGLIRGLIKFFAEEAKEPEHAQDEFNESAHSRSSDGKFGSGGTVYHGSDEKFSEFDPNKAGTRDPGYLGRGFYFSTDPNVARTNKHKLAAEVHVKNPLQIEIPNWKTDKRDVIRKALGLEKTATFEQVDEALEKAGHDGVILDYSPVGYAHQEVMVKNKDQIKNLRADDSGGSKGIVGDSAFVIAMDRDIEREKTRDGRMVIKRAHITKANVCPYRGSEIPDFEKLGLDPDRVYNLLRDPEELRKAAPTLNGVQLLIKHTPVHAKEPHQDKTVGSLGTDATFDGEYLDNSIFVNVQEAIDAIESGVQRELSAGYFYVPDMTPGNFRGTAFDGVMREIVFNHVALVEDGRAGPDAAI
jgi:hypothetical protein